MAVGTLTGCGFGAALPATCFLFGELLNALATADTGKVSELALLLTLTGVAALVFATISTAAFAVSGERQTRRLRRAFFQSVLAQEPAFFDEHSTGELMSCLSSDVQLIAEVLGDKSAAFVQCVSGFVLSYIMAFFISWRTALVLLAAMPVMLASGALACHVVAAGTARAQALYGAAGAVALEALGCIRTVHAFDGAAREAARYDARVAACGAVGVRKGLYTGLALGLTPCVLYFSFALAF